MKKTILVADDNRDDRLIYCTYLTYLGYEVIEATDGREACELALRKVPSLILMDIAMPRMSGHDAVRKLRNSPDTAALPIIGMTAYAVGQKFTEEQLAHFDEVLWKPIEPKEVASAVRRHIGEPADAEGSV